MQRIHLFRSVLAATVLLQAACGGPAPTASPAPTEATAREQPLTPLTATITSCTMSGFGRPNFTCTGVASGGTPPYLSLGMMGLANATVFTMMPMWDDTLVGNGRCTESLQAQVRFEVMDSAYNTTSVDAFFPCTVF